MKYKIIGFVSILLALGIATCGLYISKTTNNTKRYHQHIEKQPFIPCKEHDEGVFCTHLPIVTIDTDGVEIPGKLSLELDDANNQEFLKTIDKEPINAKISVFDAEEGNNHLTDETQLQSKALINVRGYSSRSFDKSNYAIKLIDEEGKNSSQEMLGMDAHHEWALHGPFLDKTLIRNYMWYNIAGEIMEWAPNVRFCEVFVNDEYRGVYVMTETISGGKNGARLNISVDKKENSFTGYILRLDRGSNIPIRNINTFSKYTYKIDNQMDIIYPGARNLSEAMKRSIELDCSKFEKTLYSFDFNDDEYGYKANIDVDSFVDYFLINELTSNYDAGLYSTYIYKDISNKYKMCVWDFNSVCDGYQDNPVDPHIFQLQRHPWFYMLCKDEDFVEKVIKRYHELRKTTFSDEYLIDYIDDTVAYLGPAIDRNFQKWGYTFDDNYHLLSPHERDLHSYEEAIEALKDCLLERAEWMDENIDSLKQYCEKSKDKRFDINAN